MYILKYENNHEKEWDEFVSNSINGTIYHSRKFLNYHKDKFIDCSILIYNTDGIICVLPCCQNGDKYFSHNGATFGGPVFKDFNLKLMKEVIDMIFEYYENRIEFRLAGNIYFEENQNKLLYLLNRKLNMKTEISWFLDVNQDWFLNIRNKGNRNNFKKFCVNPKIKLEKNNDTSNFQDFYNILENNLKNKHNTIPTHSYEELINLKKIMEDKLVLYVVKEDKNILGGVLVIKASKLCWYTIYISKNMDFDFASNCSLLYVIKEITFDARRDNIKYIDYGISTENVGTILNEGLSVYKEQSLCGSSDLRYNFVNYI